MSARDVLAELAAAGVFARADPTDPDRLRLWPPELVTPELARLALEHKTALLPILRRLPDLHAWHPQGTPQ